LLVKSIWTMSATYVPIQPFDLNWTCVLAIYRQFWETMLVKGRQDSKWRAIVVGQPAMPFGRNSFGDSKATTIIYVRSEQSAPLFAWGKLCRKTFWVVEI
jgi:hypothetical protein